MLNHKISKKKRIEVLLAMLEDKAFKYASLEHENEDKAIKHDDMLLKTIKEMVNLIKMQAELDGELKPVQVVVEKVQGIFVDFMSRIKDPQLRSDMVKKLEVLRELNIN